ncbi:MAG: hypothetical protein ACOCWR_09325, partial [Oceanidesulfovibrio sp.]
MSAHENTSPWERSPDSDLFLIGAVGPVSALQQLIGFFDNENGILGGHGDSVLDIRHCEFGRNSLVARPGTHNLYIGRAKKLIFQFNYSHHAKEAHLLKSRAVENIIAYNRIADEHDG